MTGALAVIGAVVLGLAAWGVFGLAVNWLVDWAVEFTDFNSPWRQRLWTFGEIGYGPANWALITRDKLRARRRQTQTG